MKRSYRAQGLLLKYGADILSSRGMELEKGFFQHGTVTVYDHSVAVALMCLQLAMLLHIHADRRSLVRGALLHDYFLYDWHVTRKRAAPSTAPTTPAGPWTTPSATLA